jgi:drug/metabolite transporter (DMT)-like permease
MTGDLAAIVCAAFFAFCSLAFAAAGRVVGSMIVNQVRILLAAIFLFGLHAAMFGELWPSSMNAEQTWLLVWSGVIGLALGDLCYFHSLTVVGPRLGTLLMATFPIFVVLGEGLARDRWPGGLDIAWMISIVAGVMVVLTGKQPSGGWRRPPGRSVALAIGAGILGAVGQGAGLVLAKLAEDASAMAPQASLSVTLVRMVAGLVVMAGVFAAQRIVAKTGDRPRMTPRAFNLIFVGVIFGPTLGVWLSMVAVSHIDAGRASVLIALTPVLMLPITWIAWGERPDQRAVIGTMLAFLGTAALLWNQA